MRREHAPVAIRTFVINLDRDVERLATISGQLNAAGMAFERLPAVNGRALPDRFQALFPDPTEFGAPAMTAGEVGCYASHLCALELLANDPSQPIGLILEDDALVPADLQAQLEDAIRQAPQGWDIMRLTTMASDAFLPVASLNHGSEIVRFSRNPMGTCGYLISPAAAQRFAFNPRPRIVPIDVDYRADWYWGLETYGIMPPPIGIADCASTIDTIETRQCSLAQAQKRRPKRPAHYRRNSPQRLAAMIKTLGLPIWLKLTAHNLKLRLTFKEVDKLSLDERRHALRVAIPPH